MGSTASKPDPKPSGRVKAAVQSVSSSTSRQLDLDAKIQGVLVITTQRMETCQNNAGRALLKKLRLPQGWKKGFSHDVRAG